MHFCQHQFAVSADIEGMFIQTEITPCDQTSSCFPWPEDAISDAESIRYTWHIFGARDSPMRAIFPLQQTARVNVEVFPEVSRAMLTDFYMDDYLESFENRDDAMRIIKDLVKLLELGGFRLTKIISIVHAFAENLNPSTNLISKVKDIGSGSYHLNCDVLGLKWNHGSDSLVVSRRVNHELTKHPSFSFHRSSTLMVWWFRTR